MEEIRLFTTKYGSVTDTVVTEGGRRFSNCLENVVCDKLLVDCKITKIRCLFACERFNEVISERSVVLSYQDVCDDVLSWNKNQASVVKKRAKAYCMLHLYEKGLADLRLYLQLEPEDRDVLTLYRHLTKKALTVVDGVRNRERHQREHVSSSSTSYPSYTSSSQYPSYTSSSQYPSYTSSSQYSSYTSTSQYPSYTSSSQYPSYTSTSQYPSYTSTSQYPSYTSHYTGRSYRDMKEGQTEANSSPFKSKRQNTQSSFSPPFHYSSKSSSPVKTR